MALEGTLKDFSLADIFQLIGLQRKTGVLTLKGADHVTVTFLDGQVVAAESHDKRIENRLGHVLVKKGNITSEQLNRALDIQKETLQRLGFILVNNNFISREQLREALQMQILGTIYRLFRWQDGEYHFSQESTIEYDRENVVPITAESVLMEGARMIDEWPIIEKRIRSYDMVFRRKPVDQEIVVVAEEDAEELDFDMGDTPAATAPASDTGDQIRITAEEKATYDLVNGTRNVGEIVEMSRLSEFDTNKYLYELLTRDLIEEARLVAERAGPAREPVGQTAATEVPTALPLPLILLLGAAAAASLVTFGMNPLNSKGLDVVDELKKAISLERIARIGYAIDARSIIHGTPPEELSELSPELVSEDVLEDPWGRSYSYLSKSEPVQQYIISGSDRNNNTDTDLFLARNLSDAPAEQVRTGGIELVD